MRKNIIVIAIIICTVVGFALLFTFTGPDPIYVDKVLREIIREELQKCGCCDPCSNATPFDPSLPNMDFEPDRWWSWKDWHEEDE